jgi:hypothetical protein
MDSAPLAVKEARAVFFLHGLQLLLMDKVGFVNLFCGFGVGLFSAKGYHFGLGTT